MDKDQEWDSVKAFALPPDFIHSSFTQATKITATDHGDNIYKADIKRDWCIGLVPHGGYITSIVATAVQFHFQTKHPELSQPDLITFHIEFLARTTPGPAELHITELKLGRQFSNVRAQLLQYPSNDRSKKPRICLEAVFTQGNLTREAKSGGISLPTKKVAGELYDVIKKEDYEPVQFDERWKPLRPAVFKMDHWVPKGSNEVLAHPKLGPSVREEWVRWTTSSPNDARDHGFTPLSLPYVADAFRPLPEAYGLVGNWYPTLSYGLEVKKAPPTEKGWEWLYFRVEMLVCKGGRFDLRLLILDEEGEVVALGNHVALAVSQERNMKVVEAKI